MKPYDNLLRRFEEISSGVGEAEVETEVTSSQQTCEESAIARVNLQSLSLTKEELQLSIDTAIEELLPKITGVLDTLLSVHTLILDPEYDIISAVKGILEALNTSIANLKLNADTLNACGGNSLNDELDMQINLMQNTKSKMENLIRNGIGEAQVNRVREIFKEKYDEVYMAQIGILRKVLKEITYGDTVLSKF